MPYDGCFLASSQRFSTASCRQAAIGRKGHFNCQMAVGLGILPTRTGRTHVVDWDRDLDQILQTWNARWKSLLMAPCACLFESLALKIKEFLPSKSPDFEAKSSFVCKVRA